MLIALTRMYVCVCPLDCFIRDGRGRDVSALFDGLLIAFRVLHIRDCSGSGSSASRTAGTLRSACLFLVSRPTDYTAVCSVVAAFVVIRIRMIITTINMTSDLCCRGRPLTSAVPSAPRRLLSLPRS